jgi:SagB-type dehydrogenase family enzyme
MMIINHLKFTLLLMTVFLSIQILDQTGFAQEKRMNSLPDQDIIQLPAPAFKGRISLEETIKNRQSIRDFSAVPLTIKELSQLFWALQGATRDGGARTAPSAGALFPLEVYVALQEGVFQYSSGTHSLVRYARRDIRHQLAYSALGQDSVRKAPAVFVITAVYERTAKKYGNRAERYVKIEAGHAAQNLLLQSTAMGLGAVPIGAFHDEKVKQVMNLPINQEPLYLIPVGRKR